MNKKFRRFSLGDSFVAEGKPHSAYSKNPDGMIKRNFEKTNKKWRKENGKKLP